jgi:hypothetical protein
MPYILTLMCTGFGGIGDGFWLAGRPERETVPVSSCERQEKVPNASAAQKVAARHAASAMGIIGMATLQNKQFQQRRVIGAWIRLQETNGIRPSSHEIHGACSPYGAPTSLD